MSKVEGMQPGPALDALVAEKVMGWKYLEDFKGDWLWRPPYPGGALRVYPPNYSTSIAAAWEVVEKFNGKMRRLLHNRDDKGWGCIIDYDHAGVAPTAPHAICLAALKAAGYSMEPSPSISPPEPAPSPV